MGVKPALNAKKTYTVVAAVLVVCLVLSVYLSLQFSVNASIRDQNLTQASPNPTPAPTTQPTGTATNTPLAIPTQRPLLAKGEALKIAMPLIEQYASKKGRVISLVNATFCTAYDTDGIRGGVANNESSGNSADIIAAFQNAPSYPAWSVDAFFENIEDSHTLNHMPTTEQGHVYGYNVLIWADNGQICSSTPQIWC